MVFRSAWRVVYDVVSAFYFAGEDIVVDIAYAADVLGSEDDCRLVLFLLPFSHM
jgi:hypothetical protein